MRDLINLLESILSKADVEKVLRKNGYEHFKESGSKLTVLVQIPDGKKKDEFRSAILMEILGILKHVLPKYKPMYSDDARLSSLGGIVFGNSNIKVLVKDLGKQGDQSAGVANEIELASILQSVIDKYGSANITFEDPRGKTLKIKNCVDVEVAGRSTANRKKADVVLKSSKNKLPVSIKKINADMWESADNMFGARAREILNKLIKDKVIKLEKIKMRGDIPVYKLSKEIVMEPTEEEAMNAIFGSDINPEGGIVIQTFKPEHFKQDENDVQVDAHAVIKNKEDIPESHAMLWLLRNDSDRNSASLGIAGIRPLGVTATRGLGKKGDKDVIMVDVDGNVVKGFKKDKEEPKEPSLSKASKSIIEPKRKKKKPIPVEPNVGRAKRKR